MERMSCLSALALAGLFGLGACSGVASEAGVPVTPGASATPAAVAVPPPGAPAASVPAAAAEGRPAAAPPQPRVAAPADATAALRDEILGLIGTAACRDDSQCRALPLGSKPCGGPEGYLAWSTAQTDARRLEALALRYRDARQARNQRLGLVSDCSVVPEPQVRCVPDAGAGAGASGGRCQAITVRGGPGPAIR